MSVPVLQSKNGIYRVLTMTTPHRYQYRTWWGVTWSGWKNISDQDIPFSILNELKKMEKSTILYSQDEQYRYILSPSGSIYQKRGWYDTWHDIPVENVPVKLLEDFTYRTNVLSDKLQETVEFLMKK